MFATSYKTSSRIELAFANPTMLADIMSADNLPSGLSDHSPLAITLRSHSVCSGSMSQLGANWITHPDISDQTLPTLKEYWDVNAGFSSPGTVWDAFKAFTGGHYISAIKAVKLNNQSSTTILQIKSNQYALDPSTTNFDLLKATKRALHLHLVDCYL